MTNKPIEIGQQQPLGLKRCLQLALTSMRYRALRSSVTLSTLALAVAFLMISGADSLVKQRVRAHAAAELSPSWQAKRDLARLTHPETQDRVLHALQQRDTRRLGEYAMWLGPGAVVLEQACEDAQGFAHWDAWQATLSPGAHAALLSDHPLTTHLDHWSQPAAWDRLSRGLSQWGYGPPLGDRAAAQRFVQEDWPRLRAVLKQITSAHQAAAVRLSPLPNLQDPTALQAVREANFAFTPAQWQQVIEVDRWGQARRDVSAALRDPVARTRIGETLGLDISDTGTDQVLDAITNARQGQRVADLMGSLGFATEGATVTALAQRVQRHTVLSAILKGQDPLSFDNTSGLPLGMWLLLGLSLLVCVVGVSNAMLMSVTERFSEIATMKCIGALDGSIMGLFVIEAMCLGVIASAAGVTLGTLLALGRVAINLGGLLWETPGLSGALLTAAGFSALAGLVLAVLAAVGPAWAAARLAPMEAMRVA